MKKKSNIALRLVFSMVILFSMTLASVSSQAACTVDVDGMKLCAQTLNYVPGAGYVVVFSCLDPWPDASSLAFACS